MLSKVVFRCSVSDLLLVMLKHTPPDFKAIKKQRMAQAKKIRNERTN